MKVRTEIIKRERIKRGWNQSELAHKVGTSPPTISRLERGLKVYPRVLKEVADLLGVPVDDLLEAV